MNERQACVAFNHLLSQGASDEALALNLGAALEARGLSLPRPLLAELVALGPIFDAGQLRQVRGVGPVRHRQLVEALAQLAPDEDEGVEAWSPRIPEHVFDELDELDELELNDPDTVSLAERTSPREREEVEPDAAVSAEGASPRERVEVDPDALDAVVPPEEPTRRAPPLPSPPPEPGPSSALTGAQGEVSEGIILRHVVLAAGTGLTPFPLADLAALLAINVWMVRQLATLYGVDVHEHRVRVAVSSLLATAGVPALMLPVSSLLRAVPGLGWALGALATPSLAGTLTYATGRVFARHFAEGGQVEDFDVRRGQVAFQRELAEEAGR
ncbi:MAG: DUF697 domain-containing protein [Alphaproteobacteria bacterium]|nr:DUF697 domain-containing protein [Alphaproteobacteria bacterium]